MKTFFAPPQKADQEELDAEIEFVTRNPVISGLLCSVSGLLAVLDEHRQIVALNDELMRALGLEDSAQALGLRPGEALQCIHAEGAPAGCGTTKACSVCGAVVAIMTSLEKDKPIERTCTLSSNKGGSIVDTVLLVRSLPVRIEDRKLVLLFLQDITLQQQKNSLERTFFHDINNMLGILSSASELLMRDHPSILSQTVHQTTQRLIKEVAIQRYLLQNESFDYRPMRDRYTTSHILDELRSSLARHSALRERHINFPDEYPDLTISTDLALLLRVLNNMLINALEATPPQTGVKLWMEQDEEDLIFYVWNAQKIPDDIATRIFQLNFSTKAKTGRGIGTYSMKLLGEKVLGGQVSFTTSADEGTIFTLKVPLP